MYFWMCVTFPTPLVNMGYGLDPKVGGAIMEAAGRWRHTPPPFCTP